jgi:hypothetical protein
MIAGTGHHLRDRAGITVITNGLTSRLELADARDDVSVVVVPAGCGR